MIVLFLMAKYASYRSKLYLTKLFRFIELLLGVSLAMSLQCAALIMLELVVCAGTAEIEFPFD